MKPSVRNKAMASSYIHRNIVGDAELSHGRQFIAAPNVPSVMATGARRSAAHTDTRLGLASRGYPTEAMEVLAGTRADKPWPTLRAMPGRSAA